MERISKLLFATTALTIFCFAIIFAFNNAAGNGGEYWGFDGKTAPRLAAKASFEVGENRFLAYDMSTEFSGRKKGFPSVWRCDFHPDTEFGYVRFNEIDSKHGSDSVRKANLFASEYNESLAALLSYEEQHWCEKVEAR